MLKKILKLGVLALWLTILLNTIVSCNAQVRVTTQNGEFFIANPVDL